MDLFDLRAYIRDHTIRADLSDALIGGFIAQAESGFRRDIPRHRLAEKCVELTANVTTGAAQVPADFREARSIHLDGRPLRLVSIDTRTKAKGTPAGYYISGDRLVLVPPPAESGGKVSLVYWATVPPLTEAAPTNWVLENFAPLYIHSVLMIAYGFLRDTEGQGQQAALYQNAIGTVASDHARSAYSGGTPQMPAGGGL